MEQLTDKIVVATGIC